jgi:uncharacterized protein YdeI (YjbR/CyaY-like superfamily)
MGATFFATQQDFRKWLAKNHTKETELIVGFYKVDSGIPSMNWSQSVDQALCYGWIDGIRRTIDHKSYCIRFTPRKPNSIWSSINIKKVEALTKAKLMKPAGQKAFELRKESKSGIYSHEKIPVPLAKNYENQFKANKTAWAFFNAQVPSYKKVMVHWIMSAKQEKTQLMRLEKAIEISALLKRAR